MALDASIYGRFQPKSAASYAAEFEQLAGMREQRQDNALARAFRQEQMGQARAQAERGNALRALQQGLAGKSDEEVAQGMRAAGFIDEAATYETSALDRQTKRNTVRTGEATAVKTEADAFSSALNQYATLLPRINSPQAAQLWVRSQYEDPRTGKVLQGSIPMEEALAEVPQDPQQLPQWRDRMAMGIAEYRKMLEEQRKPAPAASVPTSIQEFKFAQERGEVPAGQTYTEWKRANARAGATSVSYGAPMQAINPETNQVELVRPDNRGGMNFTGLRPPGESEKPLSEGQAKAVAFASRMQAADKVLADLSRAGVKTTIPGATRNDVIGDVITAASPAEQQQLAQAKRDFINAVLRRESGAVIAPDEFANAERQYFPQIGDERAVIEQKARNRRTAIEGMRADVPVSRRGEVDRISSGGAGPGDNADPLGIRGGK
jgi:hypothetical protein